MKRSAAFLIAFLAQVAPSLALAWSLGAKDIGQVTLDSVPSVVQASDVVFAGVLASLLSAIGFGIVVVTFAPAVYLRHSRSITLIVFAYIACSLFSAHLVAVWFAESYGATWMPWEPLYELGLRNAVTLPAFFWAFLAAHALLRVVYKSRASL